MFFVILSQDCYVFVMLGFNPEKVENGTKKFYKEQNVLLIFEVKVSVISASV